MSDVPTVAFLGISERSQMVRDVPLPTTKLNVIGLRQFVPSFIFPASLGHLQFIFAVCDAPDTSTMLNLIGPDGATVGWYSITLDTLPADRQVTDMGSQTGSLVFVSNKSRWTVVTLAIGEGRLFFTQPGYYEFVLQTDASGRTSAGGFHLVPVDAAPLTPDRMAAIRADPAAARLVRSEFTCTLCGDSIRSYAALERLSGQESSGYLWYESTPERFCCRCGAQNLDISSVRRNLHGLLGVTAGPERLHPGFVPLYERSALEAIRRDFVSVLDASRREEILQQFLQRNPVLFHQFAPQRLFFKPPILTKFNTDFAVVSHNRHLVLIEIESPSTRLLTKKGDIAAPLQHAMSQVRNWLHVVDEHRLAALDSLGITRDEVAAVSGVVIAGRDSPYNESHLRSLKGADYGRVRVLSFDDLHASLLSLVRTVERL